MKRLILLAVGFGLLAATDRYQAERERMVRDQIEARGIRRPDVLQAIRMHVRYWDSGLDGGSGLSAAQLIPGERRI
jgi:hypothetical protein